MDAVHDLLGSIPESARLSSTAAQSMLEPITYEDLCDAFSRASPTSSPAMDDFLYQLVHLMVTTPAYREIALATFNNALLHSDLPPLWLEPYNGLLMKLVMEHARNTASSTIGLLLDQEKAYDRVHPMYLRAVLLRFGFPVALVDCISHLFFDNYLVVNVNGFLSSRVPQRRGLKQGDPIRPFPAWLSAFIPNAPSANVKMLAYADEIVCLLSCPTDLQRLQPHLHTEAISLSGASRIYDSVWREVLLQHHITSWHDARSPSPVRYLGFPLHTSLAQRDSYLAQLLEKVQQGYLIHQQRGLSVPGKSTVKLWHVLRVLTVPASFFNSLTSVISSFINLRIFPRISTDKACLPRSQGGLGLISPQIQQSALQLRWLRPLLCQSTAQILSNLSIILPRLVGFLLSQHPTSSPFYRSPPEQLDHRFPLLFPCRRPNLLRHNESSWSLLFKAIDRQPKDFSNTVASVSTCMEIPLASVILPSSSSVELFLPSPEIILIHPNLAKKFLKWVKRDDIQLSPFFVRAFIRSRFSSFGRFPLLQVEDHTVVDPTPFVESLSICSSSSSTGLRRHASSTKSYRRLCLPQVDAKPPLPTPFRPDIQISWTDFWLLPISHSCRNSWYRFLHHKFLTNRFSIVSSQISSRLPPVPYALNPNGLLDHFLFSCPSKLLVWQTIQYRHLPFLSTPLTSFDLHLLLTTTRFHIGFPRSAILVISATLFGFLMGPSPF
ncbi:hypothetical protein [Parasitella parasitica]|uniref:Reverse transcriptase domain-containing protein n=1 Tax=Parasitella parasitica TaxID=35722 RepID=A0A0B7N4F0_9FUNG|nr:hypothetical protein [Parasitella parasitica]